RPGDLNYRPPVIDPPRPHATNAADFLDELLWCAAFIGDDSFGRAYVAVRESGAIKDRKWAEDFRVSSPPGHTSDPFHYCVSYVARLIFEGWAERAALAWAVAIFDLPGASFDAAVARCARHCGQPRRPVCFQCDYCHPPKIKCGSSQFVSY